MGWVSTAKASALLGKHPTTLRRWAKCGLIKRAPGGRYLVDDKVTGKEEKAPAHKAKTPKRHQATRSSERDLRVTDASKMTRWLLIPDTHVPYQHKDYFNLVLRVARYAGIENVAILGDFADFYAVSFHSKSPMRKHDLQWEVDEVNLALDLVDATFPGQKIFVEGNHEHRLERYLMEKAPALFNTVHINNLFRLKERGFIHTTYKEYAQTGQMYLTHDVGKTGQAAHIDAMNAFQASVAIGHTHQLGMAVKGDVNGVPRIGVMLGWLGDPTQCEYMYKVKAAREWAHGFGIAYVENDGTTHITPVPIMKGGRVCVEGEVLR